VLRQLSIKDVVLIDRLELEFEPGLGVLTGETGAGKSILLDGLGLALGARADTGLVRSGETQAIVAAEFELPADHPGFTMLAEQGIEPDRGEPLLVRPTLKADGGSRAFGGRAELPATDAAGGACRKLRAAPRNCCRRWEIRGAVLPGRSWRLWQVSG